jgi:hypothetical protein
MAAPSFISITSAAAPRRLRLKDNGRIVLMMCAFDGPPKIVRLHGRGETIEPQHDAYAELRSLFPTGEPARAVIRVHVERISDSCGYGVPLYRFQGHRTQLQQWAERKGADGLIEYQTKNNRESIDGLPALDWAQPRRPAQSQKPRA